MPFSHRGAAGVQNLVGQGWTDALQSSASDKRIYTFWDYFRNAYARDAGLRIDHLLLSSEGGREIGEGGGKISMCRGWEHTGDHAPVWIELSDKPVKKKRKKR